MYSDVIRWIHLQGAPSVNRVWSCRSARDKNEFRCIHLQGSEFHRVISWYFIFHPKKILKLDIRFVIQTYFIVSDLSISERSVERICIWCKSKSPANPCSRRIQMYSAKQPPPPDFRLAWNFRWFWYFPKALFYISSNLCCSDLLKNWLQHSTKAWK